MFKKVSIRAISVLAVIAILGIGSYAWAEMGGGYGYHGYGRHHGWDSDEGYGHHGYGHHGYGGGNGPGCIYGDDLTKEEIEKLKAEQEGFDTGTRKLRQEIYRKKLALESEFAQEDPDAKKALAIQKEISDLKAQIDQKRVDYMIKTRKIAPNAGRGMMRGFGNRGGRAMGSGSGDRPCWR